MRCLDGITHSKDMILIKLWEMVKDREALCAAFSPWGCKESYMTEGLNNNNTLPGVGHLPGGTHPRGLCPA